MSLEQKNINTGGGDNVGGNLHKKTINYYGSKKATFSKLIDDLRNELQQKEKTEDNYSVLEHYDENIDREVVGLENKLKKAQIEEDMIRRAMRFKESFYKILAERRFYKSGQIIYSELMNHIFYLFHSRVTPLIDKNVSSNEIIAEVFRIIQIIIEKVGENIDMISTSQIEGILYYLTGNCHIKWHKDNWKDN